MRKTFLPLLLSLSILAWPLAEVQAAEGKTRSSQPTKAKKSVKAKKVAKAKHRVKVKYKNKKLALKRQARYQAARDAELDRAVAGGNLALRSHSALVINQATGELVYTKNPEVETPIASITKLMTAVVTLDAGLPLDEEITINSEDLDRIKGTGSRLPLGATLTRGELLNLALIASENRAAAALSRAYPGGRDAFIEAMNRKARSLGMQNTHYVDGTGLSSSNRSTAMDLARLVDVAYRQYPLIRDISTTGSYDVEVPGRKRVRQLAYVNTNALTRNKDWDIGISKTGYISEAGHCLVMQTQIAGQKMVIVLLDSWGKWSRIGDAQRIKRWIENGGAERVASRAGRPA
jgi:D-alanyl-D-alanine endopeptidase (penicillin-binding protein 7)